MRRCRQKEPRCRQRSVDWRRVNVFDRPGVVQYNGMLLIEASGRLFKLIMACRACRTTPQPACGGSQSERCQSDWLFRAGRQALLLGDVI